MVDVKTRSACRVCNSDNLLMFLDFPPVPLVEDFLTADRLGQEFTYPLRIFVCKKCLTVQTQDDVDTSGYYREFQYSLAHSPFVRNFMGRLAKEVFKRYHLKPGASVLEVGSGDGHQLSCFRNLGARVFGVEPSESLVKATRRQGIPVAQALFTRKTLDLIPPELKPLQVVLLTYTFDHLSDPPEFLRSVKEVLDPKSGLLVVEVHDLARIMERKEYCLLSHEHTTYYTVDSLSRALEREGFDLISHDLVPDSERRGNSLLVVAKLKKAGAKNKGKDILHHPSLARLESYQKFAREVKDSLEKFRMFVKTERSQGKIIAGYGAGGRGVMTLAMTDIHSDEVSFLLDKNQRLQGYRAPKSHIPIESPEYMAANWADELIVFSYGYLKEIAVDLREYTRKGGKLISLLELL